MRNRTRGSTAPRAPGGSGLHVIVWFKMHLHSYNSHEGHILLKRKRLPWARTLAIMRTDKAFDSWSDENCVFYDQYELACGGRRRGRGWWGAGGRGWREEGEMRARESQLRLLWFKPVSLPSSGHSLVCSSLMIDSCLRPCLWALLNQNVNSLL